MYRNQVWFPYPGSNIVLCLGMCGQMIYVNRAAEVVAANLGADDIVGEIRAKAARAELGGKRVAECRVVCSQRHRRR